MNRKNELAKSARGKSTPSEEYQRFEKLAKEVFSVPKSEIEKRQAQYEKQKKNSKKRRAA